MASKRSNDHDSQPKKHSCALYMASRSPFEANNSNHHRNDSFSSYLALVRQSFSNELANSRRSSLQTIVPPRRTSRDHNGELDVFTAEKYFNGSLYVQDYYPVKFTSNDKENKSKNKNSFSKSRSSTCSDTSANSCSFLLGRSRPRQQNSSTNTARRRRSFFDVFRCYCSKKNTVIIEEDDVADIYSDKSSTTTTTKLPSTFKKSLTILNRDSRSELFEIDTSTSINPQALYELSEASIDWSVTTANVENLSEKKRRPSGLLALSCVSEKAEDQKVSANSLERYHVMMDLESDNVARSRRASLG